jgi:CRP-like cAMP-binding protein
MIPSLSDVPLFNGLSPAERAEVEQRMRQCDFLPQSVIVREGGTGDAAYLILSGLVAVRRKDPDSGMEFLLAELGPGQMFGEMALLTKKPRTASVVALEATSCAALSRDDFDFVMREHPNAALGLAGSFAERLERANQHAGIDYINLARVQIDPRVLTLVPASVITEHKAIPIAFCNNRLTLAMTNPNNVVAFDDVRRILKGVMIEPVIVTEDDLRRFMSTTYAQLTAKPETAVSRPPGRPAMGPAADLKANSGATVDLLQSDLVRELQLASDTEETVETKQDLMSASKRHVGGRQHDRDRAEPDQHSCRGFTHAPVI